jgi:3-methyl-2-oxobutanoate hydroxymethyltransferase
MQGIKIKNILEKKGKEPITCLTAYSKPMAEIIDKYCDIILVGDSVGMVLYGMKTTREVKIETLILHGKAVKNSAKRSFVVFDMPHKTYSNKFIAYKNVKKVMKSTKCDAVKLEGGRKIVNIIKYLTKKGIPVMGHIGLLPQSSKVFKLKGKNLIQKKTNFTRCYGSFKFWGVCNSN